MTAVYMVAFNHRYQDWLYHCYLIISSWDLSFDSTMCSVIYLRETSKIIFWIIKITPCQHVGNPLDSTLSVLLNDPISLISQRVNLEPIFEHSKPHKNIKLSRLNKVFNLSLFSIQRQNWSKYHLLLNFRRCTLAHFA